VRTETVQVEKFTQRFYPSFESRIPSPWPYKVLESDDLTTVLWVSTVRFDNPILFHFLMCSLSVLERYGILSFLAARLMCLYFCKALLFSFLDSKHFPPEITCPGQLTRGEDEYGGNLRELILLVFLLLNLLSQRSWVICSSRCKTFLFCTDLFASSSSTGHRSF